MTELPKWAQERLDVERKMGQWQDTTGQAAAFGASVIVSWTIATSIFVAFCALVYLVGRWVVT